MKWNPDGGVRIQIGKIIPAGSSSKQTLQGRRKRFAFEVEGLLDQAGWKKIRANVYVPGK